MKLGITLPQTGSVSTRDNLLHFARTAEQAGYDSLWTFERLLYPLQPKQAFGAATWPDAYERVLAPLETLALVAGVTETIKLAWACWISSTPRRCRLRNRLQRSMSSRTDGQ